MGKIEFCVLVADNYIIQFKLSVAKIYVPLIIGIDIMNE